MRRKSKYLVKHPFFGTRSVRLARIVLWEKLQGANTNCNWCNIRLVWMNNEHQRKVENAICADHLDRDILNDSSDNIVASCRECNANRHTNGRRSLKVCKQCNKEFLPDRVAAIFCSIRCMSDSRVGIKKGTKTKHGTRSRYGYGCRCTKCKKENSRAWLEWSHR